MCEYDFLDLSSDQLFIAFSVIVGITLVMNLTLVAFCYYKLIKPIAPKPSKQINKFHFINKKLKQAMMNAKVQTKLSRTGRRSP